MMINTLRQNCESSPSVPIRSNQKPYFTRDSEKTCFLLGQKVQSRFKKAGFDLTKPHSPQGFEGDFNGFDLTVIRLRFKKIKKTLELLENKGINTSCGLGQITPLKLAVSSLGFSSIYKGLRAKQSRLTQDSIYTYTGTPPEVCPVKNVYSKPSKKLPVILALDLGTQTGWAVRLADGQITSGSESFKPGRFEGGGMRYLRFRQWLEELHTLTGKIEQIYFEEVRRHMGVDAAHAYGGFLAHLSAWCEDKGLPYLGVPVGTIKKHITGKGNAGKQSVISAVRAKGFAPADDNEADALALLDFILTKSNGGRYE